MPHHLRPLAHERNFIFKCKQHTCTLHDPRGPEKYNYTMMINLALILCKLSQDPNNGQGSDTSSQYGDHFCQTVLLIYLQGSDSNVACDTASQYGDHFCEIKNLTSKNKVVSRTRYCCKVML